MKPEIHPEYHPVIFIDDEHEIVTRSTLTSGETREIDGVEHYVMRVDISAFTHPFYTGKQKVMDTEGRVERFKKRYAKRGSAAKKAAAAAAPAADVTEAAPDDVHPPEPAISVETAEVAREPEE